MHTRPAVSPQVLGQQLHLPGKVRVHLGVYGPVHQVMRRSRLVDRSHIARDHPEHRAPEGSRAQVDQAIHHLVSQWDARIGCTIPRERWFSCVTGVVVLFAIGSLARPTAESRVLNALDTVANAVIRSSTAQLLDQCTHIGLLAHSCHLIR